MENVIEQFDAVPFYFNWTFWAVIIATIAIILSQLPPIYLLFKKAKLDIELYSRIIVTHKVGNPNLKCHVILNNIGGRSLRVKNISAKIERDGKSIVTLPAQTYDADPNGTSSIIFTRFTLKPENEMGYTINFLNYFNRSEERDYKEAEVLLKNDISKKLDEETEKKVLVKAEQPLVKPFLDMFERMFIWKPGEYKLTITVLAEPLKREIVKQYSFTLFETDSKNLHKYTEDYVTGAGVYFHPFEKHTGITIQITELA